MKPFDQWVDEIRAQNNPTKPPETKTWEDWEDEGEVTRVDNTFMTRCRSCGERYAISDYIGPEEFDPSDEYLVCGRSLYCCP